MLALCRIGSLLLASIGADGVLRIWDLDSLKPQLEGEPFSVSRIAALSTLDFDANSGPLVHPSRNRDLHIYELAAGCKQPSTRTAQVHHGDFCAVACGPSHIATAGLQDRTLKLWTSTLDRPLHEVAVAAPIVSMAWSRKHR